LRLQVSVDDLVRVGLSQPFSHLDGYFQQIACRQVSSGANTLVKCLPPHQLHRDEVDALDLLHRVDGYDIGMIESSNGLGFPLEPLEALGGFSHFGRKHF
jgi:hypothetical protein